MKNKKQGKKKNKTWFNYVVIAAVLLIPFMYSFFYLKAYWDPYGHMDDIPVAIVNEDKKVNGESKGQDLIDGLKEKNVLGISVVDSKKAEDGLNNKEYYAVITIPSDFTSNLLSAGEENKKAATITYSPNQKSNYLASQIISRVVLEAEKEVRSNVSKEVVSTLTDNLNSVPKKVEKIDDGLKQISDGTSTLKDGAYKLQDGTSTLSSRYNEFNNGVLSVNNGANSLYGGVKELDEGISKLQTGVNSLSSASIKLDDLQNGVSALKQGEDSFTEGLNSYITLVNYVSSNPALLQVTFENAKLGACTPNIPTYNMQTCVLITKIMNDNNIDDNTAKVLTISDFVKNVGNKLSIGNKQVKEGVDKLSAGTEKLPELKTGVSTLKQGVDELKMGSTKLVSGTKTLTVGTNTLKDGSNTVLFGINEINKGSSSLASGTNTLYNGVNTAKSEVTSSINSTNNDLKKLTSLEEFTANPVKVEEKDVNEVTEYGTAFSPFFISIALWVGSLMLFIILYYDANDRFKLCSRNAENKVKRTFCYLGLASLQGIILGILLKIGLGFNVTNYFLYFASMILVACAFEAIMEFLIVHFNDVGKFVALILLVLQLAAAGGTFPIETVSNGFQKLFNFLPMKYTIDLFKESLISIESNLLSKSLITVILIFILFFVINIIKDIKNQKKAN